MRETPSYLLTDEEEVRRLVREHPWATLVSAGPAGLVASHYPVVLDEDAPGIVLLSHVGRPDEVALGLGERELMVVVQGPHGYVSPSWYPPGRIVPTWNHVTAHLYGTPEVLDPEENLAVLGRLVDRMEAPLPDGRSLALDPEHVRRLARGTVGMRLVVTRFEARRKLSQDKPAEVQRAVAARLREPGPYASPALAAEMERVQSAGGAR